MIFGLGRSAKPLILHIDDEPDIVGFVTMALGALGAVTLAAYNAADGFKLAVDRKPDLILLDVQMPMTDGFETCRTLKNHPKTKDIPVVMITARGQMKDVERALAFGASAYLVKPFTVPKLLEKIAPYVKLPA